MPLAGLFPHWMDEWVVYEDDDLLVIDKPAGMSSHAPSPADADDVKTRLERWLRARGRDDYLGIHQRLDRDTSGVMLLSRRRAVNAALAEQFSSRHVEKTYVALVSKAPRLPKGGTLRHALSPGAGGKMEARPLGRSAKGAEAITRCRVLATKPRRVLVEARPETGRTHQIRAQLAAAGAPIIGDELYGGAPAPRLFLHATKLALRHPAHGRPVSFDAPAPPELDRWLRDGHLAPAERAADIAALVRRAAHRRYLLAHDPETTAFRLVHGAGDGLDGITIDVYGEHLVVGLTSDESHALEGPALDAAASLGGAGVYLKRRPKHASRLGDKRVAEVAPRAPLRGEPAPEAFTIHENGLPFEVRLGDGLSTGIFLDQRDNRARVRELARGARVLNLFGYTAGFTVAAIAGGASESVTVDASKGALAWAKRNLDAVGADPDKHRLVAADALVWLRAREKSRIRYDVCVLDPPSFATTRQSTFSAESGYKSLAAATMRLLAPGGRLLACTNHSRFVQAKLRRYLHEASRDAGRTITQMKDLAVPRDFPAAPGSEAHLKSVLVTLG